MVINKMRCHDSPHSSPLLNMSTLRLLEYILKDRSDAAATLEPVLRAHKRLTWYLAFYLHKLF